MIRSLILSYYLINLSFASLLVSFGCVCFVHILTPRQDKLVIRPKATKFVFLDYSRLQMDYHCYSSDINCYFISADVTFFEDFSFFSSTARPHVPNVLSIPFVLPSPDFPFPPIDVVTRSLQVYTRRPRPPTGPFVETSSMPQSSLAWVPQPSDDLPIVIMKGTRSTSNSHLVYNFFSFHRLSLPYFTFVSTLSFVSTSNDTWKWMLFTPMTHGSLLVFLLASLPVGCH